MPTSVESQNDGITADWMDVCRDNSFDWCTEMFMEKIMAPSFWSGAEQFVAQSAPLGGYESVRKALSRHIRHFFGESIPWDQLLLIPNTSVALELFVLCCCSPGDVVLCPVPFADDQLLRQFRSSNVAIDFVPITWLWNSTQLGSAEFRQAMEERIGKRKVRALLLHNPHPIFGWDGNTQRQMAHILEWATENGVFVLVDESLATMDLWEFSSCLGLDRSRLAWLWDAAKHFSLPGLEFAALLLPKGDLLAGALPFLQIRPCAPLVQYLVSNLLADLDWSSELFSRRKSRIEQLKAKAIDGMAELGLDDATKSSKKPTPWLWVDFKRFLDEISFASEVKLREEIFQKANLKLTSGEQLGMDEPGWFRIRVENDEHKMGEVLHRLKLLLGEGKESILNWQKREMNGEGGEKETVCCWTGTTDNADQQQRKRVKREEESDQNRGEEEGKEKEKKGEEEEERGSEEERGRDEEERGKNGEEKRGKDGEEKKGKDGEEKREKDEEEERGKEMEDEEFLRQIFTFEEFRRNEIVENERKEKESDEIIQKVFSIFPKERLNWKGFVAEKSTKGPADEKWREEEREATDEKEEEEEEKKELAEERTMKKERAEKRKEEEKETAETGKESKEEKENTKERSNEEEEEEKEKMKEGSNAQTQAIITTTAMRTLDKETIRNEGNRDKTAEGEGEQGEDYYDEVGTEEEREAINDVRETQKWEGQGKEERQKEEKLEGNWQLEGERQKESFGKQRVEKRAEEQMHEGLNRMEYSDLKTVCTHRDHFVFDHHASDSDLACLRQHNYSLTRSDSGMAGELPSDYCCGSSDPIFISPPAVEFIQQNDAFHSSRESTFLSDSSTVFSSTLIRKNDEWKQGQTAQMMNDSGIFLDSLPGSLSIDFPLIVSTEKLMTQNEEGNEDGKQWEHDEGAITMELQFKTPKGFSEEELRMIVASGLEQKNQEFREDEPFEVAAWVPLEEIKLEGGENMQTQMMQKNVEEDILGQNEFLAQQRLASKLNEWPSFCATKQEVSWVEVNGDEHEQIGAVVPPWKPLDDVGEGEEEKMGATEEESEQRFRREMTDQQQQQQKKRRRSLLEATDVVEEWNSRVKNKTKNEMEQEAEVEAEMGVEEGETRTEREKEPMKEEMEVGREISGEEIPKEETSVEIEFAGSRKREETSEVWVQRDWTKSRRTFEPDTEEDDLTQKVEIPVCFDNEIPGRARYFQIHQRIKMGRRLGENTCRKSLPKSAIVVEHMNITELEYSGGTVGRQGQCVQTSISTRINKWAPDEWFKRIPTKEALEGRDEQTEEEKANADWKEEAGRTDAKEGTPRRWYSEFETVHQSETVGRSATRMRHGQQEGRKRHASDSPSRITVTTTFGRGENGEDDELNGDRVTVKHTPGSHWIVSSVYRTTDWGWEKVSLSPKE